MRSCSRRGGSWASQVDTTRQASKSSKILPILATESVASASRSAGSRPTGKRSSVWQQHSQQSRSRQGLPLLERCMVQPVSFNVPTYIDVKALRARLRPSAAAARDADFDDNGQLTGAEADDSWLTGHLRHMAQREREFTAWHAEHGAVALRVSFTRRVSMLNVRSGHSPSGLHTRPLLLQSTKAGCREVLRDLPAVFASCAMRPCKGAGRCCFFVDAANWPAINSCSFL